MMPVSEPTMSMLTPSVRIERVEEPDEPTTPAPPAPPSIPPTPSVTSTSQTGDDRARASGFWSSLFKRKK
jgi:hypothetical protein